MDELPRNWNLAAPINTGNQNGAVSIPAVPGVSHVLTRITGTLDYVSNTTAAVAVPGVIVVVGVATKLTFNGVLKINAGTASGGYFFDAAQWEWNGRYYVPVNTGLTVSLDSNQGVAGYSGQLEIEGYDV